MEREVKDRIRRSVACVGVLTCVFLHLNASTLLCSLNISHLSGESALTVDNRLLSWMGCIATASAGVENYLMALYTYNNLLLF